MIEERTVKPNGRLSIQYNRDPNQKSRAQQQFKDECDINNIMKSYQQGVPLDFKQKVGQYLDTSNALHYKESLEVVISAQNAFLALPVNIRNRFQNDPQELLTFLSDSKNKDEAIKLGLVDPIKTVANPNNDKPNDDDMAPQKTKTKTKTDSPS